MSQKTISRRKVRSTSIRCLHCRGKQTFFSKIDKSTLECLQCHLTVQLDGPYIRIQPVDHARLFSIHDSSDFINKIMPILSS